MTDANDPLSPNLRPQTLLSRGGTQRSQFGETSEAIFMSSGYVYKRAEDAEHAFAKPGSAYVYSRYANPTVTMFEERLRLIEGAEACRGVASGMAAVFAALACFVKAGDRVVASRALFGSCDYIIKQILPGYGVETELVDGRDPNAWEQALSRPAKAVFIESMSNPALEIIDIEAVAKLTHRAGGLLFVDNVFATPLLMKPLKLGADIVIYSATKHIDGQGRSLGGAILGPAQWVTDHLAMFLRHTGPSLSPFNAWLLLKGMETLDLRVERMSRNAAQVAAFLERHGKIERVIYPGLASHPQRPLAARQLQGGGTLLAFTVAGGKEGAFRCLNALKLILISNNLGDARSLVTHPATTTHHRLKPEERAALGIDDGLIRLSVGLEDPADLTDDLARALTAV
ncbi:MAG TPA: O-succinylhomoserine sulfhydrylase [Stellaceae bacterium]|nr:O-succinylhomoserine sulfhydrylase [Stellaceae bacterium]